MFCAFFITYLIIFALMFMSIILFENNSKKIIFWGLIISLTSIFGYFIYFVFYCDKGYVKKYLYIKAKEDEIYRNLAEFKVENKPAECELMNFANRVYNVNFYKNTHLEIIKNNDEFNNNLLEDIDKAEHFIIIDTRCFLNSINKDLIINSLIEKQKYGVAVKVIYSKKTMKDNSIIKQFKLNNIRCCKFNNSIDRNRFYRNNKNMISIDGKVAYLFSDNDKFSNKKIEVEYFNLYYKLTGDVIKAIDLEAHLDVSFATKKYYPLIEYPKNSIQDNVEYQYIASSIDNSLLDLILKAIIQAKKSIIIHVDKFIPNESILEAIRLAIKSDISVKIMISNVNYQYGYYTTRSYVKELAREGVVCYFYDGHINTNYVLVDDNLVMTGTISFINQNLICDLQDVLIINDEKLSKEFNEMFNDSVKNSYKLCNPKRILFREKFFRKFM